MKIAALDLGSTGAAAFDDGTGMACASVVLNNPKAKPKDQVSRPMRFALWRNWLMETLPDDLDVIIYERPFARGQAATRTLWGYAAIVEEVAAVKQTAVLDITPSEIKVWATGHGKATKTDMQAAALGLGYDGLNEHEADAYCLYQMAHATLTSSKD
jgi:Holliday junction resolvasome RuvABC endonuclease subunit